MRYLLLKIAKQKIGIITLSVRAIISLKFSLLNNFSQYVHIITDSFFENQFKIKSKVNLIGFQK